MTKNVKPEKSARGEPMYVDTVQISIIKLQATGHVTI